MLKITIPAIALALTASFTHADEKNTKPGHVKIGDELLNWEISCTEHQRNTHTANNLLMKALTDLTGDNIKPNGSGTDVLAYYRQLQKPKGGPTVFNATLIDTFVPAILGFTEDRLKANEAYCGLTGLYKPKVEKW